MAKVITFSRTFPSYHPKAGQPTFFVEKFINSIDKNYRIKSEIADFVSQLAIEASLPKHHTIRAGNRWNIGDKFSPRIWSGKPYRSKMITIAADIEIKKIWDFEICGGEFKINERIYGGETESIFELLETIAENDGLDRHDLLAWFKYPKPFKGQIICWNKNVNYEPQ